MVAVNYYMLIKKLDKEILAISQADIYTNSLIIENEVGTASFSSIREDRPDVVTPAGKPSIGGWFDIESSSYKAPQHPVLKMTWKGDGRLNKDNIYEIVANGINKVALYCEKWDQVADVEIKRGVEEYYVSPVNLGLKNAMLKLVDGKGQIVFQPPKGMVGLTQIQLLVKGGHSVYPIQKTFMLCKEASIKI